MEPPIGVNVDYIISFNHRVLAVDIVLLAFVSISIILRLIQIHVLLLETGAGDPHIYTIDGGRYTCHVQGLFVMARTTEGARNLATQNENGNASDSDLLYLSDLFTIHVESKSLAPALSYVEREKGFGSVFSRYVLTAESFTFSITNNQGKFGKIVLFLRLSLIYYRSLASSRRLFCQWQLVFDCTISIKLRF